MLLKLCSQSVSELFSVVWDSEWMFEIVDSLPQTFNLLALGQEGMYLFLIWGIQLLF